MCVCVPNTHPSQDGCTIPRISVYSDRGVGSLVPRAPCLAFVTCSTKSGQATKTGCVGLGMRLGVGVCVCTHPGMILGWSQYLRIL